jgi:hypothetical protein
MEYFVIFRPSIRDLWQLTDFAETGDFSLNLPKFGATAADVRAFI